MLKKIDASPILISNPRSTSRSPLHFYVTANTDHYTPGVGATGRSTEINSRSKGFGLN